MEVPNFLFPSLLLLLPALYLILKHFKASKSLPIPPGPFSWPIIGNPLEIGENPLATLTQFGQIYGPLFSIKLGSQRVVVASSSAVAMEILKTQDRLLSGRFVPHVSPSKSPELNSRSVAWSLECNESWKYLRTVCRTQLFLGKAIETQAYLRKEKVRKMIKYIISNEGKPLKVRDIPLAMTFNMVGNTLMSTDLINFEQESEDGGMSGVLRTIMEIVQEELAGEIIQDEVTESHLPKLPYLQACVKETLRLHPPVPFLLPHRAVESCQVLNYTIPKDSQVLVNIRAIGRYPKYWKDPLVFKPERFLESSLDIKGHDFEFLPFGAGRIICPGLPMATKHVPLGVASLVQLCDRSLPYGKDPKSLDMSEKCNI
ncbi:hypothetical protein TIFTF001_003622 [Ficus carica]|uniref:Cytochrome P450 n=1 Tax=Ficus carica TaxID=3494 RepID=A0AA87ZI30_FICCA|nr:hypothetical protein TIFTF001_003622 [Ficus carica]